MNKNGGRQIINFHGLYCYCRILLTISIYLFVEIKYMLQFTVFTICYIVSYKYPFLDAANMFEQSRGKSQKINPIQLSNKSHKSQINPTNPSNPIYRK